MFNRWRGGSRTIREEEFFQCKKIAKYKGGIVLEGKLNQALQKIENISDKIKYGLKFFNLSLDSIDLMITHYPYGDEHRHPHHMQVSKEVFKLSKKNKIPFGFFSCLPLPRNVSHIPYLKNMSSLNKFEVLNFANVNIIFFLKILKSS